MKISIDGLNVAYSRAGAGKVVLLLHGWGASKENLAGLQTTLCKNFDVIALDLPGFGKSDTPPDDWTVGSYAKFLHTFLTQLDIKQLHAVIGHSFGGRLIIKGVSEGLLHPKKVVLIGSAGVKHSNSLRNKVYKIIAKIGKAALWFPGLAKTREKLRTKLYSAAGSSDYLQVNNGMKKIFIATVNEDLSQDARAVTQPTLLVWGSEDNEAPLGDARLYASVMADATLKIVQEAGHFVHVDSPRKVEAWVESFLG